MFGISFSEILLILVIAVIIFGPEQLPGIARKTGALVASLRNMGMNLRSQFYEQSGLNQFENIRQEVQATLFQLKQQIHSPAENAASDMERFTEPESQLSEYYFLYQPELDFERQPELFDEQDHHGI